MILFDKLQEYVPTVFETYVSDIEVDNKHVSKPVPNYTLSKIIQKTYDMSSIRCSFKIQDKINVILQKQKNSRKSIICRSRIDTITIGFA